MVNLYYLDASAWIKRYYREAGSDWVGALFHQETLLASSSLGLIEVLATLSRKAKAGEIDRNEATIRQLAAISDWNGFLEIRLNSEVTEQAKEITMRLSLRGADAVHLASALALQAHRSTSAYNMIFVSSDTELNEAPRGARTGSDRSQRSGVISRGVHLKSRKPHTRLHSWP